MQAEGVGCAALLENQDVLFLSDVRRNGFPKNPTPPTHVHQTEDLRRVVLALILRQGGNDVLGRDAREKRETFGPAEVIPRFRAASVLVRAYSPTR
jgi:hypothetical protein